MLTGAGKSLVLKQYFRQAFAFVLFLCCLLLLAFLLENGISKMLQDWQRDEYNHGYMIPLVALGIILQKQLLLPRLYRSGSWWGLLGVLLAMLAWVIGELATVYEVVQYGMVFGVFSLFVCVLGWRPMVVIWVAFIYLLFMVPLPNFVFSSLSHNLQLISSSLGVAIIRLFGISVFLEGNVIDLGVYKLQVVEACSGLRYLFPLMSFGFLLAYLFKAPLWQRVVIFLTSIPITVLMNSLRIGLIGVSVEYWGIEMAEGVLHAFEGWVVFMACVGVLVLEMWLFYCFSLYRKTNESFFDHVDLSFPENRVRLQDFAFTAKAQLPIMLATLLLASGFLIKPWLEGRDEVYPERLRFNNFPLFHDQWLGRESSMEQRILDELKLDDYIVADFRHPDFIVPVNLYLAFYGSQRQGSAIHSPRTCIPGGGWKFNGLYQVELSDVISMAGSPLKVNRVVIRNGNARQLVYYWFEQRGRNVTSEFEAKWYVFWDAITQNRTDGALVRLVIPIPEGKAENVIDAQAEKFLKDFYPLLSRYIPGHSAGI